MNLDLRPLTVSEFLDRTFSIYRHRFLLFVALMAPQALFGMCAALIGGWMSHRLQFAAAEIEADPVRLLLPLLGGFVVLIVFWLSHWIAYAVGAGATAAAVSDLYGRMSPTAGTAFAAARRRLGPLLWLAFLVSVRVFGVMAACFAVPTTMLIMGAGAAGARGSGNAALGATLAIAALIFFLLAMLIATVAVIFMMLRYAVALPAVMLEPIGGRRAIVRSIQLMKGRMLAALLLTLCAIAVAVAASLVLQVPFSVAAFAVGPETRSGFVLQMIGTAIGTIGQGLVAPLTVIGMAVLYFEARVRHEALDLQVMTDALAPPPAPQAAPAVAPPLAP
jgi:hypothetical protein